MRFEYSKIMVPYTFSFLALLEERVTTIRRDAVCSFFSTSVRQNYPWESPYVRRLVLAG